VYTRVVVPLDRSARSEVAAGAGAALATRIGATLELVAVVRPGEVSPEHEEYLAGVAAGLPGGAATEVVESDDVARGILAAVGSEGGGVLCMSTHGRSGVGALVLGSVSENVIGRSTEPVILVGPSVTPQPALQGRVLVGLDGSSMAEQLLEPAAAWARALGTELWLLQVQPPDRLAGDADVLETSYLHRLADRVGDDHDVAVGWDVVHDHDPADALVRVVRELPAALLAVSTHGRSGLQRVAMGSVAMKAAHKATSPILAVRPEGAVR
jgi:nucleotide-binding universal stress UspA family protein